jgi:hypothetical protein
MDKYAWALGRGSRDSEAPGGGAWSGGVVAGDSTESVGWRVVMHIPEMHRKYRWIALDKTDYNG